jgi:pyrroline-5-carboxylate reductase
VKIVFIGGGRITSALLAGLRLANYRRPIIVHDRNPGKLRQLKKLYSIGVEPDLERAVHQAQLLVIAVRPTSVGEVLSVVGKLGRSLNAVSLAAGIPLKNLRSQLGPRVFWARAMPSPVCRIGQGLTALSFERGFPAMARRDVKDLFGAVGQVLIISESKFDAFTVTYSSSHGYHALATLTAAAQELGLSAGIARIASAHALADGIVAWRKGEISLDALIQEAATPGGIAAAVMGAMDRSGYGQVVRRGLRAGLARAQKNSRLA